MALMSSPRFAGSATLNACLNGTRTMPPNNGASTETDTVATKSVQRALVDLGYLLSYEEVDGTYGNRTSAAVGRFKADRGISPSDGIVGKKTSQALDDEFPTGFLTAGIFSPFVAAGRVDATLAGLLVELSGFALLPWASQTPAFALQELTSLNLTGIVRASQANNLKPLVPLAEHTTIDNNAAVLAAASTANGPFSLTTRFDQSGVSRGYTIFQDAYVDRAAPGGERHVGALLSLAHELTHFRNRVIANTIFSEGITPVGFVDAGKATAFSSVPGNTPTNLTRSTFIEEIGCRQVAWKLFQELVASHAAVQFAAGVITRAAALTELATVLLPGQLFRSAVKFAGDGAEPNKTYFDNGYMSDLLLAAPASFNQQVAIWMQSANRLSFHNDPARTAEIQTTLNNEFASQSPGFATPGVAPAGLISG